MYVGMGRMYAQGMAEDEVRITLPMPQALLDAVDAQRGGVARTVWIRAAIRDALPPPGDVASTVQ
jgi:hypothetical protein